MHDLLDDYAHENGFRDLSPRLKLLLGTGSILICAFSTSPLAPLLVACAMSGTTVFLAGIPGRFYSKLMAVPLAFVLFSTLAVVFLKGGGVPLLVLPLGLSVSREGLELAFLLLARTLGGTSSLFFIALTTPMVEIFSILKSLGLPAVLVELSMLIYRYTFVLLDQAAMIHDAETMRLGDSGLRSSLTSFFPAGRRPLSPLLGAGRAAHAGHGLSRLRRTIGCSGEGDSLHPARPRRRRPLPESHDRHRLIDQCCEMAVRRS